MSKKKVTLSTIALALLVFGAHSLFTSLSPAASPHIFADTSDDSPNTSLSLMIEPDQTISPVMNEITGAQKSVDLVMYELEDPAIEQALADDTSRGVNVRVLLNGGYYGKPDTPNINENAYEFLQSHNVSVHWTPAQFALTHQKTLIVDDATATIMTFNMSPQYYAADRDFGIVDGDASDVAAIEQTFDSDWNDANAPTQIGKDLVWSPDSREELLTIINGAQTSLQIYNEEMNDANITAALVTAAQRGVDVQVVMTDSTSWHKAFDQLTSAGVHIKTFDPKATLYIHAKMVLADDETVFVGSENFSPTSLDKNRELGIVTEDPTIIGQLEETFTTDFGNGTLF